MVLKTRLRRVFLLGDRGENLAVESGFVAALYLDGSYLRATRFDMGWAITIYKIAGDLQRLTLAPFSFI
jgi:hypothetical protein